MPEKLWDEAVSLAQVHGVYAISRALRINYGTLKKRVGFVAQAHGNDSATPSFVELDGSQLVGSSTIMGFEMELTGADGEKLTFRLPGRDGTVALSIAQAFWSRGS